MRIGANLPREEPKRRPAMRHSQMSRAEQIHYRRWLRAVLAYQCFFKVKRPGHVCKGRKQAHHLLEKADIWRRWHGEIPDEKLWAIMYAPAIGAPLCGTGHHLITYHYDYIYFDELSDECIEHAAGIEMLADLERSCPKR